MGPRTTRHKKGNDTMRISTLLFLAVVLAMFGSGSGVTYAKPKSQPAYIAIGGLTAFGENQGDETYVDLFRGFLESKVGLKEPVELKDLTFDGIHPFIVPGLAWAAATEIQNRNFDADKRNDVKVVTLDLAVEDWMIATVPGMLDCFEYGPVENCIDDRDEFVDILEHAAREAAGLIRGADPNVYLLMRTGYVGVDLDDAPAAEAAEFLLEGNAETGTDAGLNDAVRAIANEYGAGLADVYGLILPSDVNPDAWPFLLPSGDAKIAGALADALLAGGKIK